MRVLILLFLIVATTAKAEPVGFLFFGDFGNGNALQKQVAQSMTKFCSGENCQFVVALGDNFYPRGVSSVDDPQFRDKFELPYKDLGLVFYPVFGNHDYDGNTEAQLNYSKHSKLWAFPAHYYQFNRASVDFFGIDTEDFSFAQMSWLNTALTHSSATWKIVYGHRPVFSFGKHGHSYELWLWLLPLLRWHQVDMYLSGHDHNRQVIAGDKITYIVSGAASDPTEKLSDGSKEALFAKSGPGFGYLIIEGRQATIKMVDETGKINFEHTLKK